MAFYRILADAVVVVHGLFIAFVILGLLLTVIGAVRRWRWVRNIWFRAAHLAAIGLVVAQAWLGVMCPLTTLEASLRRRAGQDMRSLEEAGFIAYWLHRMIFFEAEPWVFTVAYTVFGTAVLVTFIVAPPRVRRGSEW